jgi:cobalt-zinc-cadmium efflux system protein
MTDSDSGHGHDHGHDHGHGHSHGLGHSHHHGDGSSQAIVKAMLVTIVFMVVELVGGYLANSLALISDAAHMLTDVGAMLFSLIALWIARRPATRTMSFGYHRAEILGALASGLAIWMIAGVLVYEAVIRIMSPPEVNGPIVFVVASIGLAANLVSMKMLHGAKDHSLNVKAAYLHLLSDTLGSVGAIIAGAVIWATGWRPIDPIMTIVFAGLMLVSSWELVKEATNVLMESTPSGIDPERIHDDLSAIPGVIEVHDLHVWAVTSGRLAMSAHVIAAVDPERILGDAHRLLRERHGVKHSTIQVEHPDRFDSERCYDCAPPSKTR